MKHKRSTHHPVLLAIALTVIASSALAAGAAGSTRSLTASHTSISTATVALRKTSLGQILVNARGQTLYLFQKDRKGQSTCYDSCATFWPPLLSTNKPRAGAGVRLSLLTLTKRQDGRSQVTYAGHPLYTFTLDKKPGQTNGEGSTNFGAAWYVVAANGRAIKAASAGGPYGA